MRHSLRYLKSGIVIYPIFIILQTFGNDIYIDLETTLTTLHQVADLACFHSQVEGHEERLQGQVGGLAEEHHGFGDRPRCSDRHPEPWSFLGQLERGKKNGTIGVAYF